MVINKNKATWSYNYHRHHVHLINEVFLPDVHVDR